MAKNRVETVVGTSKLEVAEKIFIAAADTLELLSEKAMKIQTNSEQEIIVGKTQKIVATEHTTFDESTNVTVKGSTHSVGDVSTDAGNAPTLATHKHKEIPGSGDPADTTVADA